ncbi:hypothetical protein RvY_01069 [Ramazzottius varieornatus]|uniref:Uncharacterized protein n=1 Tax=Ramazzottius varieornatus TaxID=947166 RepID=A0A1D1UQC3_RAMVA|nr:hypothetical protein RvY_01069 [Ramazzottius varieornatus]
MNIQYCVFGSWIVNETSWYKMSPLAIVPSYRFTTNHKQSSVNFHSIVKTTGPWSRKVTEVKTELTEGFRVGCYHRAFWINKLKDKVEKLSNAQDGTQCAPKPKD